MDFVSKIILCMSVFQVPYKAVLVSLYEYAVQSRNEILGKKIKEVFDLELEDLPQKFRLLGLDDSLVRSSYVINTSSLQERIKRSKTADPELDYHKKMKNFS